MVLLLNNRSVRKSRANLFLSILLLSLSFSVAHILFAGSVLNHFSTEVYTLGDPTFFLIAPLLWLYIKELIGERVKISFHLIFHFLPFLLIIFLSLTLNPNDSGFSNAASFDQEHKIVNILFWVIVVAQFSLYQFYIRKKWMAYQKFIHQEVSNKEGVDISWVRFFLLVFLLINLFFPI